MKSKITRVKMTVAIRRDTLAQLVRMAERGGRKINAQLERMIDAGMEMERTEMIP